MQITVRILVVCALVAGFAKGASAQNKGWEDRAYINIGFGVESGKTDMTDSKTFSKYEETGTLTSTSSFTSGSLFDVSVGARIWKNLSVGVGYHQETDSQDGQLTGTVPHPLFFNQPRTIAPPVTVPALQRKESAEHLMFGWMVPVNAKMDVSIFAGPSFFRLEQQVVSDALIVEKGSPYTEVVVDPTVVTRKKSVTGYNAGADISYLFWQNDSVRLGGGIFLRYTAADTTVHMMTTDQPTKVGGFQFGFGGRVRF
jgi:hypothetical protein